MGWKFVKNLTEESGLLVLSNPGSLNLSLQNNQSVKLLILMEEGSVARKTWEMTIDGFNTTLEVLVLIKGTGKKKFWIDGKINHLKANSKSNVTVMAALSDQAILDFVGNVYVNGLAQGTSTFLKNKTLLLSSEAKAKTIPALEIIANEVKAGHAASVGKFDEEQLFYLQSRGFEQKVAEKMLIDALWTEGIEMFSDLKETELDELRNIINKFVGQDE
ncbi:SufD family Fe-S cluster assembly protein [Candidatus Peregrinibacteria bacterium]|nr:SufD family Fe-S cluster assembly protein [Candidatus Peregrinibacteria bacterium]